MYRDAKDTLPFRMPDPKGAGVIISAWVDASHGMNMVTRKSHTGFIIFCNQAPILWYSKKQSTVESSAFSSEFIAMKVCVEAIQGLIYKLRMFGIPILGNEPAYVFCDNESVVKNCTRIEFTLNKKHSAIAYHYVRWCVSAGIIKGGWVKGRENLADAFTKRLSKHKKDYLFSSWCYF